MPKREMTIGVTVNLQNYESLRIEVKDDVETGEDVRALAAFLDEGLALFGRGDAATQKVVDHYRKRVLSGAIGGEAAPATSPAPPAPVARPAKAPALPAEEPAPPGPVPAEEPLEAPKPAPKPAPPAKAPAKAPAPSPTGAVCETCGAPVSAAEEKTSRLFVSKVLCKKCIQTL